MIEVGGSELVSTIDMAKNETMEFNSTPETAMEFRLRNTRPPDTPKISKTISSTILTTRRIHIPSPIYIPHMKTFPIHEGNITQGYKSIAQEFIKLRDQKTNTRTPRN